MLDEGDVLVTGHPAIRPLLLLVVLVLIWPASPALSQPAAGATLTVLRGTVNVLRADGSTVGPAASGLDLGIGDQVATLALSKALVTFFDGTEIELEADTTLVLRDIVVTGTKTAITVESLVGSSVHRVATLVDPGSTYQVKAGGTVALVRGTVFSHTTDDMGDVTVSLQQCGQRPGGSPTTACLEFPWVGRPIQVGESCKASHRGNTTFLECRLPPTRRVQQTTIRTQTVRRSR
jgi:hypothetical protein